MYLNLIFSIYVGYNKPWRVRNYNRLEIFDEALVAFATFQLVYYTDFLENEDLKTRFGWMLISTVTLLCLTNFYLVMKDAFRVIKPRVIYAWI